MVTEGGIIPPLASSFPSVGKRSSTSRATGERDEDLEWADPLTELYGELWPVFPERLCVAADTPSLSGNSPSDLVSRNPFSPALKLVSLHHDPVRSCSKA